MAFERKYAGLAAALILSGCGNYPRDPEDTLNLVRQNGSFRVGLIAGGDAQSDKTSELIERIAAATGAQPATISGDAEPLLMELEEGKLDLVVGTFDEKTPWDTRVTVGPPLERRLEGKSHQQFAPAMRNGENAWIALVERQVRDIAPEAQ